MSSKVQFTEERVQKLICPAGTAYELYWDAGCPHLGARVTEAEVRSYVYQGRIHGKALRVTIGDVRSWPLAKARKEARRLQTLVDRGIDPRQEAEQQRAQAEAARVEAQRQDLVLSDVWRTYIDAHKASWGKGHLEKHITLAHPGGEPKKKRGGKGRTKPGPLASLMPSKLSELTAECIESWLKRETAKRPTSTALAYRLLRAFIRWANEQKAYKGIIPADAYSARGVRKAVPAPNTTEDDCLQKDQLPAWFGGVRGISNLVISVYLRTLLLTGARRESLLSLLWDDVNFQWGTLTLRTTAKNSNKGGSKRTIPMPPYVASLLQSLPRKNQWVFYSDESESGRLVEPRLAHNDALASAGLPHLTLNGLRRSFCTLAEWVHPPSGVVNQIQGRKPKSTEVDEINYKRRSIDFLRMWHEKIEAWFLEQAGVSFTRPGDKARLGVVNADGSVTSAS